MRELDEGIQMKAKDNPIPNTISSDPEILGGALCFTGTRVPVRNLFDFLEGGDTIDRFLANFPRVRREQVLAVLEYSEKSLASAVVAGHRPAARRFFLTNASRASYR